MGIGATRRPRRRPHCAGKRARSQVSSYFRMVSSLAVTRQDFERINYFRHTFNKSPHESSSLRAVEQEIPHSPSIHFHNLSKRTGVCRLNSDSTLAGVRNMKLPSASCLAMRSCSSRTFFSSSSILLSSAAMGFRWSA